MNTWACVHTRKKTGVSQAYVQKFNLYELEIIINGPDFFVLYFLSLWIIVLTTQLEIRVRNVGQKLDFFICPLLSICVSPVSSRRHQAGLNMQDTEGNTHEKMLRGLGGWKTSQIDPNITYTDSFIDSKNTMTGLGRKTKHKLKYHLSALSPNSLWRERN